MVNYRINGSSIRICSIIALVVLICIQFLVFAFHRHHIPDHHQSRLPSLSDFKFANLRSIYNYKDYFKPKDVNYDDKVTNSASKDENDAHITQIHQPNTPSSILYEDNDDKRPWIKATSASVNNNISQSIDSNSSSHHPTIIEPSIIYSSQLNHQYSALPSFTADGNDYILSSLIERSFDEFGPFITAFFLSHSILDPPSDNYFGMKDVSPETKAHWRQAAINFQDLDYDMNGKRPSSKRYWCRIRHSNEDEAYVVSGDFLPNKLTADSNSNKRLDILRCHMHHARNASKHYRASEHRVSVEIICDDVSLIRYQIPWQTRRTGYLLDTPYPQSRLNAWQSPSHDSLPIVHLCMPGSRFAPSQQTMPWMLEYLSHHLLLGFNHIHLGVSFNYDSIHMVHLTNFLSSYIIEGKLSIISQTADHFDFVQSIGGLSWDREIISIFQSNTILYLAKGMADYLAVFDIDEFLILKPQYISIQDLLRHVDVSPPDRHPYCYLRLSSNILTHALDDVKAESHWLSEMFPYGVESKGNRLDHLAYSKAIHPTRYIYQAGITSGGGCRLPRAYTPCNQHDDNTTEFCYKYRFLRNPEQKSSNPLQHIFDEVVQDASDVNFLDKQDATLYHFLIYYDFPPSLSETQHNEYHSRYFPSVYRDLSARNLTDMKQYDMPTVYRRHRFPHPTWDALYTNQEILSYHAARDDNRGTNSTSMLEAYPPFNQSAAIASIDIVTLPHFTDGYEDYVLSSVIERESDTYKLFVSTFFLARDILVPKEGDSAASVETVHPSATGLWLHAMNTFNYTDYHPNGERIQSIPYLCKITHSSSSSSYYTNGRFVPNRLTPDSNSNRRLDILRCPMEGGEDAYRHLDQYKQQDEHVVVEIYRDKTMLIRFRIPWLARMTGYMLSPPPPALLQQQLISTFDPWQHVDVSQPPSQWNHDRLYMCVPGLESAPDKITLPLYLEFIEHHLQLGVDRIFIVASLAWGGRYMQTYLRVWEDYIKEGRISVQSSSYDGYDFVYSFHGLQLDRDNVKNFYVNMCTYFSKGVADYVAVWDFDELFTPMGKYQNILDLIDEVDVNPRRPLIQEGIAVEDKWRGGKGLADRDGHPLCYMIINSLTTLQNRAFSLDWDVSHSWIGQRFDHGAELTLRDGKGLSFKKSIRPTRTVYQGGLHMIGACRLPADWSGCHHQQGSAEDKLSACYRYNGELESVLIPEFNAFHPFDAVVMDKDAKTIPVQDAFINHIQFYRYWFGATDGALQRTSEYSDRFFPQVLAALSKRGLDLMVAIPESSPPSMLQLESAPGVIVHPIATTPINNSATQPILIAAQFISTNLIRIHTLSQNVPHVIAVNTSIKGWQHHVLQNVSSDMSSILCQLYRNDDQMLVAKDIPAGLSSTSLFPNVDNSLNLVESLTCAVDAHVHIDPNISYDLHLTSSLSDDTPSHQYSSSSPVTHAPTSNTSGLLLCISSYSSTPSRHTIGMLLEFITYHLLLGVTHIRLYVAFTLTSQHFHQLQRILRSYIDGNKVSLISRAQHQDFIFGKDGLIWDHMVEDQIIHDLCWSHALDNRMEYVAVWNVHDFLIPAVDKEVNIELSAGMITELQSASIIQLLDYAQKKGSFQCTSTYCYLDQVTFVLSNMYEDIFAFDRSWWTGQRFRQQPLIDSSPLAQYASPAPRIYSTKHVDSFPLHQVSAPVALVYRFIAIDDTLDFIHPPASTNVQMPEEEAEFRALQSKLNAEMNQNKRGSNIYCDVYFPIVYAQLKAKRLDLLVDIPRSIPKPTSAQQWWKLYEKLWKSVYGKLPWEKT